MEKLKFAKNKKKNVKFNFRRKINKFRFAKEIFKFNFTRKIGQIKICQRIVNFNFTRNQKNWDLAKKIFNFNFKRKIVKIEILHTFKTSLNIFDSISDRLFRISHQHRFIQLNDFTSMLDQRQDFRIDDFDQIIGQFLFSIFAVELIHGTIQDCHWSWQGVLDPGFGFGL